MWFHLYEISIISKIYKKRKQISDCLGVTQAGIKIAVRNINNLRYADDTALMAESEEKLKNLLMKVREESEKVGLKLNIMKTRNMASGPINGAPQNKVSHCFHCFPIYLRLLNLCWHLPTNVHLVKAMVFPVVMCGCESWTIKKADLWRIDAFELWCWRRLLRVPWTARRSNQSILKEIGPEHSLEALILKLKL